jgi:ketosteroid isomerase-like protein
MNPTDFTAASERIAQFFETLQPADLPKLAQLYSQDARFKDPFNDVTGVPAITAIFEHMFANLHEPRFVVTERVVQGEQCVLVWEFHFRFKTVRPAEWQRILGASHLRFDAQGQVTLHRDYWDAAEELYEKLPVVGSVMRWLKKRAAE